MVLRVDTAHTRLDHELAVYGLFLDQLIQCLEVGELEATNFWLVGVFEEDWLAMAAILGD